MWKTWKYTLPAFLVPFAFVLSPNGQGLLLQGSFPQILFALVAAAISVLGLSAATGAWIFGRARIPERILCGAGGVIMLYLEPLWVGAGAAILTAGMVLHLILNKAAGRQGAEESAPVEGVSTGPVRTASRRSDRESEQVD